MPEKRPWTGSPEDYAALKSAISEAITADADFYLELGTKLKATACAQRQNDAERILRTLMHFIAELGLTAVTVKELIKLIIDLVNTFKK